MKPLITMYSDFSKLQVIQSFLKNIWIHSQSKDCIQFRLHTETSNLRGAERDRQPLPQRTKNWEKLSYGCVPNHRGVNAAVTSMSTILSEQLDTRITDHPIDETRWRTMLDQSPRCRRIALLYWMCNLVNIDHYVGLKTRNVIIFLRKGHIKPVCKDYFTKKALGLE